jgi:hypothetical protein
MRFLRFHPILLVAGVMLGVIAAIVIGSVALPSAAGNGEGGCYITGGSYIEIGEGQGDSSGGNAMGMKDGSVRGKWQHTTHSGDVFNGKATWLRCWHDGGSGPEVPRAEPNIAEGGGYGQWNGMEGYTFVVLATDRSEGGIGSDSYSIQVFDSAGALVYEVDAPISAGNIQIHPLNQGHPYTTT